MVLGISYASMNLRARDPTLRTYPLVVQSLRTSSLVVQHA